MRGKNTVDVNEEAIKPGIHFSHSHLSRIRGHFAATFLDKFSLVLVSAYRNVDCI